MRRGWRTLLAALLLGWPGVGAAETLGLDAYRGALAGLQRALAAGDLAALQAGARDLLDDTVRLPDGTLFATDESLLRPLAQAPGLEQARALAPRLGTLARALGVAAEAAGPATDRELFDRLAAENAEVRPTGDGFELGGDDSAMQALGDLLRPVRDFLAKLARELTEWLRGLFEGASADGGWLSGAALPSLINVLIVVFAGAVAILALRAWRARRRPAGETAAPSAAPAPNDDDPLSRDEGGWRQYARDLGRAGRTREAIRAWYHAVLVGLYGRGIVVHRKGRTNWELVAALSPALTFRPALVELTRLFDREWYGLRQSAPEALATAEDLAADLLAALDAGGGAG